MKIQNIIPMYQQPKIEDMVGQQKQEYPKPSIPPELPNENIVTIPVEPQEQNYNSSRNEIQNRVEADLKNGIQDKKEDQINSTPSLTDSQTLALKTNSVQGRIDAYAAGAGIDRNDNSTYNNHFQKTMDNLKNYQEIQDKVQKQNGIEEYQSFLGLN